MIREYHSKPARRVTRGDRELYEHASAPRTYLHPRHSSEIRTNTYTAAERPSTWELLTWPQRVEHVAQRVYDALQAAFSTGGSARSGSRETRFSACGKDAAKEPSVKHTF